MTLDDLRGKHHGRPAFVLGSGPSLRFFDDERAAKIGIIFTTNSAILKATCPNYHVICDPACAYLRSMVDLAPNGKTVVLCREGTLGDAKNALEHSTSQLKVKDLVSFKCDGPVPLTRDSKLVTQWTTTPISAVHLAIIAGCNPIVLSGCDCHWEGGRKYFYNWAWDDHEPMRDDPLIPAFAELIHPATGKPGRYIRPHRRIEGVNKEPEPVKHTTTDGMLGAMIHDWRKISKMLPPDVEIWNTGMGFLVDMFPIMGPDVAFRRLKKSSVYYVDVDGTLTGVGSRPWCEMSPERLKPIKDLHMKGHTLYLWSAQGAAYARHFAEYNAIETYFAGFLDKPDGCFDDVPTIRPKLPVYDLGKDEGPKS